MFFVIGEEARCAVPVVDDLVASRLKAFRQPGGTQSGGSLFTAEGKRGSAGRRANQGNFLRLTDNFDRQGLAPCPEFSKRRAGLPRTEASKIANRALVVRGISLPAHDRQQTL
jgi:hypothetical protein